MDKELVKSCTMADLCKGRYVIPLYQRGYTWGEEQITRLIQDIYDSMSEGEEEYYIGTLVVLRRDNGDFEVIDGQQRLTTLALLLKVLKNTGKSIDLDFDTRDEVRKFLTDMNDENIVSSVKPLADAVKVMRGAKVVVNIKGEKKSLSDDAAKFADFLLNKVHIIREEMPTDTDVANYFEVMNNRGVQLREHEIVKALLLSKLNNSEYKDLSGICGKIWDACSQMNTRIQRQFSKVERKLLFGCGYNEVKCLDKSAKLQNTGLTAKGLDEIISDSEICKAGGSEDEKKAETTEESVLDFSDFLMHVFKLYYDGKGANEVPLNENKLLATYKKIEDGIVPIDFFNRLLRTRVVFDRFMVKSEIGEDNADRKWTLKKPEIDNEGSVYFNDSFGHSKSSHLKNLGVLGYKDKEELQDDIVMALSCLQVSFSSKNYKWFLHEILGWFKEKDINKIDEKEYLEFLHGVMKESVRDENDIEKGGTAVPRYVFNLIDYLYYRAKKYNGSYLSDSERDYVNLNFRFTYSNSVEHHYPQSYVDKNNDGVTDEILNCIGNLMLLSSSENSSRSNKSPEIKAEEGAKRDRRPITSVIYGITKECVWKAEQIVAHKECVMKLWKNREAILKIED